MTTDNTQPSTDPLKSVAQALQTAAATVRDSAGDATARVREGLPAAGQFVSRFVYTSCYFASYGIVFPTVFVASFVPGPQIQSRRLGRDSQLDPFVDRPN